MDRALLPPCPTVRYRAHRPHTLHQAQKGPTQDVTDVLVEAIKPFELKQDQTQTSIISAITSGQQARSNSAEVISGCTPLLHHQVGYLVCVGATQPENQQVLSTISFKLKSSSKPFQFSSSNPRFQNSQRLKISKSQTQTSKL